MRLSSKAEANNAITGLHHSQTLLVSAGCGKQKLLTVHRAISVLILFKCTNEIAVECPTV